MLLAVDLAERGLAEHPDDLWLRHRAVLALARSGSTAEAAQRFDAYGLGDRHEEDIAALGARLAKDEALASEGAKLRTGAAWAAEAYEAIFSRTGGYYPAVNAATLKLLAGDTEGARALARQVVELTANERDSSYYGAVSEAEARLILGEQGSAAALLERAAALADDDFAALATTRRQLRLICEASGADAAVLDPLSGPTVAHYCGHRIAAAGSAGRFQAATEEVARKLIAAELERRPVGIAYGSLASGGDLLWAEELLDRGCELNVVLPFDPEEFVQHSVAPSGASWVERFRRFVAAAETVTYATDDAFLDDDVLYRYGAQLAMGLALLRARYLDADVRQLALWDGGLALGDAGTAIDVETWRDGGLETSIVWPANGGPVGSAATPTADGEADRSYEAKSRRVVRAMIFADVKGFSKLTDEQLPRFAERVLGGFAAVLDRYSDSIGHQNTWGDALYVVCSGAAQAASCALDLQAAIGEMDLEAEGLPPGLALRLGAHWGPVFPTWDPVLAELAFMGSHVSRTARLEPVTPPGSVYATQPFAAALALHVGEEFACDYVGHMPAAKDFGRMRMYRLRRRVREGAVEHLR